MNDKIKSDDTEYRLDLDEVKSLSDKIQNACLRHTSLTILFTMLSLLKEFCIFSKSPKEAIEEVIRYFKITLSELENIKDE